MTQNEMFEDLMNLVSNLSGTPRNKIQGRDHLRDDLGLDSMKSMELLSKISEQYDIDVDVEALMELERVDDVVNFLKKHMQS